MRTGSSAIESQPDYDVGNSQRLALLAATANDLLTHSEPAEFLKLLFDRLAAYCGLEVCFSYRVVGDRLQLAFASGVSERVRKQIEWLDFGQAVCGTVAQRQSPITAEHIQANQEPMTTWVRSMAVQAYCCHPLIARGTLLGTLSFGTRTRASFTDAEVALMKAVSDQAAAALERFLFLQELRNKNAELERANEDLRQFAYAASHDLQEPVRTISIYTQLLARTLGQKLSKEAAQQIRFVTGAAAHLENLLKGLLTYTQASNGIGEREEINIREALGDALVGCRALLDESGADLSVELPSVRLRANRPQLAEVFQNLLSNAVKYRRPGECPRIAVRGQVEGSELVAAVQDNGQGIAAHHQDRIFQLFKRLHGREIPGTGIGLATAKRIVERYGGRIWVDSQLGAGSTFYFALPVEPAL
jgi:signal transduction histidine kinase